MMLFFGFKACTTWGRCYKPPELIPHMSLHAWSIYTTSRRYSTAIEPRGKCAFSLLCWVPPFWGIYQGVACAVLIPWCSSVVCTLSQCYMNILDSCNDTQTNNTPKGTCPNIIFPLFPRIIYIPIVPMCLDSFQT